MEFVLGLASLALIIVIWTEGFEAMVLPQRVTRSFRFTQLYYRGAWAFWLVAALLRKKRRRSKRFLSLFGPLSMILLFATWIVGLIFAFAGLNFALQSPLHPPTVPTDFGTYLYLSGVTLFTLGYGEIAPAGATGRFLAVVEAGSGFAFLAIVIGYLPVLHQAFSKREALVLLLDARAGSPPTAGALLLRLSRKNGGEWLDAYLSECEHWAAGLLESHLSFPMLSYYRSQHDNQSWLAALTVVLDACALLLTRVRAADVHQAELTFAMARHVVVDLAQVFGAQPKDPIIDRLPEQLVQRLAEEGLELNEEEEAGRKFNEVRAMYEPYVLALGRFFHLAVPSMLSETPQADNWQSSPWRGPTKGIGELAAEGQEQPAG